MDFFSGFGYDNRHIRKGVLLTMKGKKRFVVAVIAVMVLFLVVLGIIAGVMSYKNKVAARQGNLGTGNDTISADNTASLYGDVNPDEEDNVENISEAKTMKKEITKQLSKLKEAGFGQVAYSTKKVKIEDATYYQVYADKTATDVYLSFTEEGPSALCKGKTDADQAALRAAATAIIYVCTSSVGNLNQCASVFDQMETELAEKQAVTYNHNYTEYLYEMKDGNAVFYAKETEVVG